MRLIKPNFDLMGVILTFVELEWRKYFLTNGEWWIPNTYGNSKEFRVYIYVQTTCVICVIQHDGIKQ